MAYYLIGDVQGCFDALQRLLKKLKFSTDKDQLLFLGDVVNRGDKSLQTLNFIKDLQANARMVLGNHDFHLLNCALTGKKPSSQDTIGDILTASNKNQLIDFLLQKPLVIKHKDALMVHAGIPPLWNEKTLLANAQQVQQQLQSERAPAFIANMYGDYPKTWQEDMSYQAQCRYSINALMRMRFCTPDARLEFAHKTNHNQAPTGYKAWFLHDNRVLKNTDIFFGHWSTLKSIKHPHIYPLDYGCVWGGRLAGINLASKQITTVNCNSKR